MILRMRFGVSFSHCTLGKRILSPGKVAEMKLKIEAEKKALVQKKDMEEEEKNKAAQELEKREEDLVQAE